jgi:ABC-type glycerol-3-phosphate transport system substrate-binding protein
MLKTTLALAAVLALAGCEQVITRNLGGTTRIELPCDSKFMHASWKDVHVWYSYRPANPGEPFVTVTYKESSNMGFVEGKILFVERACK